MIVDQNTINHQVPIPQYDSISMNHIGNIMNINPINAMPLSSYEGLPSIQPLPPTQNNPNVSMSIPVNNMSVNVNMNVSSLNLGAVPAMPVNTINGLQLPLGIQPMNISMIDGQRNFTNISSGIDIPITRPTTVYLNRIESFIG